MKNKYLSKIQAATKIFKERKIPLTSREIVEIAMRRNLIKVNGLTPHATMNADFINEGIRRTKRRLKPRFSRTSDGKWKYDGD
jgi:hypothetical protein